MSKTLLLILALLSCLCRTATTQDDVYEYVSIRAITWQGGKPRLSEFQVPQIKLSGFDRMLAEEEIQNEMELSSTQKKDLKSLLNSIKQTRNKLRAQGSGKKPDVAVVKRKRKEFEDRLDEILVPSQAERMGEIDLRLKMRTFGLPRFLRQNGKKLKLELTAAELKDIETAISRIEKEYRAKVDKAVDKSIEKILSEISASQRKQIQSAIEKSVTDVDLFLAQGNYIAKHDFEFGTDTDKNFDNLLEFSPTYFISYDGRFIARKTGQNPIEFANFVQQFSRTGNDKLDLSPLQGERINVAFKEYWAEVKDLQEERKKQMLDSGKVTEVENKRFNGLMAAAGEDLNEKCKNLLLKHQLLLVRKNQASTLIPRLGPIAEVLKGDTSRKLKLKKSEKEEMLEKYRSEIESLEKELLDWDEKLFSEVKKQMKPENRAALSKAIGERMKHVVPTYRVLVQQKK